VDLQKKSNICCVYTRGPSAAKELEMKAIHRSTSKRLLGVYVQIFDDCEAASNLKQLSSSRKV
jgi:hypothetical protein